MERFGDGLKQAREARGESLEAIGKRTRIARRYLEAIEASDVETLPGGAFDIGYIRSYSEFLGIDAAPFVAAYHVERAKLSRPSEPDEREPLLLRHAYSRGLVLALALGSCFVVAATALRLRSPQENPPSGRAVVGPPRPAAVVEAPSEIRTTSEPLAATSTSPLATRSPIAVTDSGVGKDVIGRNLIGPGDRFAEGTQVVFWTRVVGATNGAVIRHVWLHEGRPVMRSELSIGGPHWRTFSRIVLPEGGLGGWVVEARGPNGDVLARERFFCSKTLTGST